MKAKVCFFTLIFIIGLSVGAYADYISTSANAGNPWLVDYGYSFMIEDGYTTNYGGDTYKATLTNTSTTLFTDPLIDALGFNMLGEPVLNDIFTIENVSPTWGFSMGTKGVKFDYIGSRDNPEDRIGKNELLTFDIIFQEPTYDHSLALWYNAPASSGGGMGGGDDYGQVGVSFQQLGYDCNLFGQDCGNDDSDLLASYWDYYYSVPEPGTLLLLSTGLFGLAAIRRRKA